jgi:hypothetical protein
MQNFDCLIIIYSLIGFTQSWKRNFKNVALQKQKTQFVKQEQYAKRNCAVELFKAHCAATINAKNTSFHKKIFVSAKNASATFLNKKVSYHKNSTHRRNQTQISRITSAGLSHHAIRAKLTMNNHTKSSHKSCD